MKLAGPELSRVAQGDLCSKLVLSRYPSNLMTPLIRSIQFIRSLLLALVIGFGISLPAPTMSAELASQLPERSVLILLPFQPDLLVSRLALQTLQEEFSRVEDMTLLVYYEFLDTNRFSDAAYQQQLFDLYAAKYSARPIDLVLVETETTLNTWLTQRDRIAPGAPVVYFDTLTDTFSGESMPPYVTGVGGSVEYAPTIEWIMNARPDVKEVALVYGVGEIDLAPDNIRPVREFVRDMEQQIVITDLSGLPFPEIERRVAALPASAVVLSHPVFEDAAGVRYNPTAALDRLVRAAAVPVINGFDLSMGTGIIGGKMYSLESQARQAAQIGLRILRGEAVSAIPHAQDVSGPFIVDHLALQRFDIPLSSLPPDTIIRNRQYSFLELYTTQIVVAGAGFAGLLLLVVFLLAVTQKLSQARLELAQLNTSLEGQVQDRTAMLKQTNKYLQDEITERKQLEEELQRQATTDGLTGISNRRNFLELMKSEIKRAIRLGHPLAVAMIDIDHFKLLNDTYGHAAGDHALLEFVRVCQRCIRDIDVLARFGGDEFVMLLPDATCDQAADVLERVRHELSAHPLELEGQLASMTISVGITNLAADHESVDAILSRSDIALYQAKEQGRNRIAITRA